MNNQVLDNQLNLALDATAEELEKSTILDVGYNRENRQWEAIVRYAGNRAERNLLEDNRSVIWLSGGYGIVRGTKEEIEVLSKNPFIEYIEKPKRLYFATEQGKIASCIESLQSDSGFSLFGRGVLTAVLDSGIDYTHPEFCKMDGSSKILAIWDQTGKGNPPSGFDMGTEYSREEINAALTEGASPTGQSGAVRILNTRDLSGHGTAVAAIAAGNSGVAPQAQLLIVKLGNPLPDSFPKTTELMMAVEYAYRKALEVQMPLVINLSFGTVYGPHEPYN